jgi:hypothetical protein
VPPEVCDLPYTRGYEPLKQNHAHATITCVSNRLRLSIISSTLKVFHVGIRIRLTDLWVS